MSPDAPAMTIAYLVNLYPATSHSFIRREIAELEKRGLRVERFSIRSPQEDLVDPADQAEARKTRGILGVGYLRLVLTCLWYLLIRPRRWLKAAVTAVRMGRKSRRGLVRHLAYLCEACVLMGWLRSSGAQHLHAHFGTNSAAVALLCHHLGLVSYSFTAHGIETFDEPESLSIATKIERASFAVAVSEFGRGQLYRWSAPEDWTKIHVIRCGVDGSFLNHPGRAPTEAPRLVCVGRLCKEKGQLLLVDALALLAAEGAAFDVVLIGDGEMREEIESRIEQLQLRDSVRVVGWRDGAGVREEILSARALVLPSLAEGLPVVIMEALSLGRPVVSTYVAGIPELVEPGVCGWLSPAGSVDSLSANLRLVLSASVEYLEALGRAGAANVAARHNAATEAGKLAQLFASVVSSAHGTSLSSNGPEAGGVQERAP